MPNPFEDDDTPCLVLVDDQGRYSLWPAFRAVPAGWRAVHPATNRGTCLARIEEYGKSPGR